MNVLLRPVVRTSVGSKYVMALTGLALIGFVIVHMAGNLLVFRGREALNGYAHTLDTSPGLVWTVRVFLLVVFVVHVVLGIRLALQNRAARPNPYVYKDYVQASWASRHVLLTGLVLLAFVVYHLLHFTAGVIDPVDFKHRLPPDPRTGYADVAEMVTRSFRQWWIALSYIVAQVCLGLHLWHGAGSWFQSLGLNHPKYAPAIRGFAVVVATVVAAGNISIPLALWLGWSPS
jgi:succinate dehydrogenase / fumarate reductase cytochrome b subunit